MCQIVLQYNTKIFFKKGSKQLSSDFNAGKSPTLEIQEVCNAGIISLLSPFSKA